MKLGKDDKRLLGVKLGSLFAKLGPKEGKYK